MPGSIYDFFVAPGASEFFREMPGLPTPDKRVRCGKHGSTYVWSDLTPEQIDQIVEHVKGYAAAFNSAFDMDDDAKADGRRMRRWLKALT